MKKAILLVNLGVAVLAAGTLVYAAVDNTAPSTLISEPAYRAARQAIDGDARVSAIVCKRLAGYELAVCLAEQSAEKKVQMADLEARYLGTVQARHSARITHYEAQYDVDKARCEAFSGEERDHCVMIAAETRNALINEARLPA
jgi:hypothetical protein